MSWIDNTHPEYDELQAMYEYIQDHYESSRIYDKLDTYLIKKTHCEPVEAYDERKSLADSKPYFACSAESIARQSISCAEPVTYLG